MASVFKFSLEQIYFEFFFSDLTISKSFSARTINHSKHVIIIGVY